MLPRLAIALFALFFNYQASADELLMKNGSLLVGTLVSASDSTVVFDTPFAGEITLWMTSGYTAINGSPNRTVS
ncbi:MAG: hypothetical protein GWP63_12515 [Haliea sp.]|nr:hypothetical protein [Haliea sp.]